mmetsp:Transcript_8099/g.20192  ORF Transcript_8099/g.20192 Transcript_8099/m.20192 type:complete len:499 (-) Transcript_8099:130-1626(-)
MAASVRLLAEAMMVGLAIGSAPQWIDEHFQDLISHVSEWCYDKLSQNSSCCLDEKMAPGIITQRIDRRGTSWSCDHAVCFDAKKGPRGTDALYYPRGANLDTPRLLYVHGGSWYYGSPFTTSYPQLLSRLSSLTGFVIMAIDYPLAPVGNASRIVSHTLAALNWLATNGPDGSSNDVVRGPPLFIGGDSSGGGSAMAALLMLQRHPDMLVGGSRKLAGGFFYSPWTNLKCNTPEYYSHAYSKVVNPILNDSGEAHVGDLMFNGFPNQNSESFEGNALEYVGHNTSLLIDPIYSPFYATAELLRGAPPMYFAVGGAESIEGDSTILAQKAAMMNVPVYLDIYDGMWHVFPMYTEGCQNPEGKALWTAVSAQRRTADFLKSIASNGSPPCPPAWGRPATWFHYSEPGKGRGDNQEWFPSTLCGEPVFDKGQDSHWTQGYPIHLGGEPSGSEPSGGFSPAFLVGACTTVAFIGYGLHVAQLRRLRATLQCYKDTHALLSIS